MDPVSQGALGAAFAQSFADRRRLLAAGALGLLGGMAPDLDVLIRSSADPLRFLEYHRQFTHALVFIPVGALACALVLHGFVRHRLRFRETWLFCGLGYATHGLLDACTSYGTQLLWPFSDARIAWNHVAVVDPLFTVPLLGLLVTSFVSRRRHWAWLALGWAFAYIGAGAFQGQRAEAAARELAQARGHAPGSVTVKPSFGNLLVWKSLYVHGERHFVDAVRAGMSVTIYTGESLGVLDVGRDLPWLDRASRQARDLERFRRFSAGHVALDPESPAHAPRVVDVRYSMVPNEIDALWGIQLDPLAGPDAAVRFFMNRQATAAHRAALGAMLLGRALDPPGSSPQHAGTPDGKDRR